MEDPHSLEKFLQDFTTLSGHKILIHGGGRTTDIILKKMGIQPVMVQGRRITDEKTLEVVVMIYAGLLNKKIVAGLAARKCNALGLSGADLNTVLAEKRQVLDTDFGYAGDIKSVNHTAIISLLQSGITPVFCSVTHNGQGQLLNTNADTITAAIGASLSSNFHTSIWMCFEKRGLLIDMNDDSTLIPEVNSESYRSLCDQGFISNGMRPKLDNAFYALKHGVKDVNICHYSSIHSIPQNSGTRICL